MSSSTSSSNRQGRRRFEKSTTRHEISKKAFTDVVQALQRDMGVVMHGSGDVPPSEVNPQSVRLLSELTANYISNLVHAAVDSQQLLLNEIHSSTVTGGMTLYPLPPPPLSRSHKTPLPRPTTETAGPSSTSNTTTGSGNNTNDPKIDVTKIPEPKRNKRRRVTDEFWDEPLPTPKIKNKPIKATESKGPSFQGVPIDEWVGVSGVDFYENHRARHAHIGLPMAIGTQSFIFPVCHDVGLYGRILEVQAARRNLGPLLADPIIQDVVRQEAQAAQQEKRNAAEASSSLRKKENNKGRTSGDDSVGTNSEEEEIGAIWPGLDLLLPFHTTADHGQFM